MFNTGEDGVFYDTTDSTKLHVFGGDASAAPADGGTIGSIDDSSDNNKRAVQNANGNRPTWRAPPIIMEFDRSDDEIFAAEAGGNFFTSNMNTAFILKLKEVSGCVLVYRSQAALAGFR